MFKVKIDVDLSGVEQELTERFGDGSAAQYEWSRIVFAGSEKYVPFVTGHFINSSRGASEPLFAHGELVYTSAMASTGEAEGQYANYLWESKSKTGKPLEYSQLEGRAGTAGGHWTTRAANDLKQVWINELQGLIDEGKV